MRPRQTSLLRSPDAAELEAMALRSVAALPEAFRAHLDNVVVRIEEYADDEMLASVDLADPMELSGLYSGRPVGEKSIELSGTSPDMIHLFRQPILAEAKERGIAIERLVHHVVIHEIGHHFGLSDEDMHALEEMAD